MDLILSNFGKTASNSADFLRRHAPKFVRHGVTSQNQLNAAIAPAVERTLGKGEVACSNHAGSTIFPHAKHAKLMPPIMHRNAPPGTDGGGLVAAEDIKPDKT